MGRSINTTLPISPSKLEPDWPNKIAVEENMFRNKEKVAKAFNEHNNVRALPKLNVGDRVAVKTDQEKCWETKGIIRADESSVANRSLIVETDDGALLRRNRRHIANAPHNDENVKNKNSAEQGNNQPNIRRSERTLKPPKRLIETI